MTRTFYSHSRGHRRHDRTLHAHPGQPAEAGPAQAGGVDRRRGGQPQLPHGHGAQEDTARRVLVRHVPVAARRHDKAVRAGKVQLPLVGAGRGVPGPDRAGGQVRRHVRRRVQVARCSRPAISEVCNVIGVLFLSFMYRRVGSNLIISKKKRGFERTVFFSTKRDHTEPPGPLFLNSRQFVEHLVKHLANKKMLEFAV